MSERLQAEEPRQPEETLQTLGAKIDALMRSIDGRFDRIDQRFGELDKKVAAVDTSVNVLGIKVEALDDKVKAALDGIGTLLERDTANTGEHARFHAKLEHHDIRLMALEHGHIRSSGTKPHENAPPDAR